MQKKIRLKKAAAMLALVCVALSAASCGTRAPVAQSRAASCETGTPVLVNFEEDPVPLAEVPQLSKVLVPEASGAVTYTTGNVTLDASNAAKGYIMVKYSGSNSKIKIRVVKKDGTTYTYNINARNGYEVFPLTEGSGSYTVSVYENVSGTQYAQAFGQVIDVQLENDFLPFLYPNQYVNFSEGSAAVKKAAELSANAADDKAVVAAIYSYVINNITYDQQLAATVQSGYIPNVDSVLANKKGICYDYSALMTAMLRSRNIPTKMVWGYAGEAYHAWINVYLDEVGWVDNAIYFDGKDWKLMDPTFASSGKNSEAIKKYIGDGAHYQQKYTY